MWIRRERRISVEGLQQDRLELQKRACISYLIFDYLNISSSVDLLYMYVTYIYIYIYIYREREKEREREHAGWRMDPHGEVEYRGTLVYV